MTDKENELADEAFALLAEEPSLRSVVDDLCVEVRELRCQLSRIEGLLLLKQQQTAQIQPFIWTTGGTAL